MTDIEHEDGCAGACVLGLINFQVFFFEGEVVDPVPFVDVRHRRGEIDIRRRVAERSLLRFAQPVDSCAGVRHFMHAEPPFAK